MNTAALRQKEEIMSTNSFEGSAPRENTYSCRAESPSDACLLLEALASAGIRSQWKMASNNSPMALADVNFEMRTEASLDDICAALSLVPDGHVMLRTLRPSPLPLADNNLAQDLASIDTKAESLFEHLDHSGSMDSQRTQQLVYGLRETIASAMGDHERAAAARASLGDACGSIDTGSRPRQT